MRVVILGSTGMIGGYCFKYLSTKFNTVGLSRSDFNAATDDVPDIVRNDVVINCVGIVKPYIPATGIRDTIFINSIFPHLIKQKCDDVGARLIHICSDCVYSGGRGNYKETDICDASDLYARSKTLSPQGATIIRSSIIGDDLNTDGCGLVRWLINQKEIDGYTNCLWNGVTALQLSKVIEQVICEDVMWEGVRHIFSSSTVSKHDLCKMICDVYGLSVIIKPKRAKYISGTKIDGMLDRSLSTIYDINDFDIRDLREQIIDMKDFSL